MPNLATLQLLYTLPRPLKRQNQSQCSTGIESLCQVGSQPSLHCPSTVVARTKIILKGASLSLLPRRMRLGPLEQQLVNPQGPLVRRILPAAIQLRKHLCKQEPTRKQSHQVVNYSLLEGVLLELPLAVVRQHRWASQRQVALFSRLVFSSRSTKRA